MSTQNLSFDALFCREFWSLLTPYWTSQEKWTAWKLFGLNLLCTIVSIRGSVAFNATTKDFFDALQQFNQAALSTSLIHFAIILTIILISYGYAFYFNGLLSIRWRRWLTHHYLKQWIEQQPRLTLDNPDQRISEDLEKFPDLTLTLFFRIFQSCLLLTSFGYVLWHLSGKIIIPLSIFHFELSGYLFFSALIYALLGTWIIAKLGKRLARLDYQQQYVNANFRFSLITLRESGISMTLDQKESIRKNKLVSLFNAIFDNFSFIIVLKKRLLFFTSGYNNAAYLLGLILALPLYLHKTIQFGGMMQISGAFSAVIMAFSAFINEFSLFAEWRAVIHRLAEFHQLLNHVRYPLLSRSYFSSDDKSEDRSC